MHSCPLSHIYERLFVKATFSKSIIFKVKKTFEANVFKWVIKNKFINSSPFALLIINVKILYIFKRNGAHLIEKMMFEKNKDCPFLKFECIEHAKTFLICVKF